MDDDLYVVSRIDEHRSICISTLPKGFIEEDVSHLGAHSGFYIYEMDDRPMVGGIIVLAKAASSEAALRLAQVWRDARSILPSVNDGLIVA